MEDVAKLVTAIAPALLAAVIAVVIVLVVIKILRLVDTSIEVLRKSE